MELHEALSRIETIHRQMARTEKFRGYGALPTALGSLLAIGAGLLQPLVVPRPEEDLREYLALWVGVAMLAGTVSGGAAWRRHRSDGRTSGILIRLACEQFLPCVFAGAAVTLAVAASPVGIAWMLPGLWAILFSLGLFASLRLLPDAMLVPAAWYLIAGCACIALGPTDAGLTPTTMMVLFGVGQLLLAGVLARQHQDDEPAVLISPAMSQSDEEQCDDTA